MNKFTRKVFSLLLLAAFLVNSAIVEKTLATDTAVFTSLKMNTAANQTFTFVVPGEVTAGNSLVITYPSDFSLGSVDYTDLDVSDDGVDLTLAATPLTTTWGVTVTPGVRTIEITSGTSNIAAASVMVVKVGTHASVGTTGTHQVVNPTVIGSYTINITAGGSTSYNTVRIITDDQVALSALVGQTLSFTISDNTVGFGSLSVSEPSYATGDSAGTTVETSAHSLTASTNAASGYTISVRGASLTSGLETIPAIGGVATALSAGSAQFGMRATAAGGAGSVSSPYASSDYAYGATASTVSTVATSVSASAVTTYSVYYGASISSQVEPGSYTATLTYTISANY